MNKGLTLFLTATLLGLAACHRPVPPAETPAPEKPAPAAPAVQPSAGAMDPTSNPGVASAAAPAPATQKGELDIASMKLAAPPSKRGVAVDLRYQFDGDAMTGQPVTLHLVAVPRVAGSNLNVSIKDEPGISTSGGAITAQKANASAVYRQQISVTKRAEGPAELHVLVTMETSEGSAHSWFSLPLSGAIAIQNKAGSRLE